jgi:hypothetical protein
MKRRFLCVALTSALSFALIAGISAAAALGAFGFKEVGFGVSAAGGGALTQAGAHPFEMTTRIAMNTTSSPAGDLPDGAARDIAVRLPPGLVGNPTAVPRCPNEAFTEVEKETFHTNCEDAAAVGIAGVEANFGSLPAGEGHLFYVPVYNLRPLPGEAARLGFIVLNEPIAIDVGLAGDPPYEVLADITHLPQPVQFFSAELTLWGTPADSAHDPLRGHCLKSNDFSGVPVSVGECPAAIAEEPFLTLPRSCEGRVSPLFAADSWEDPGAFVGPVPAVGIEFDGCDELGFDPTISAQPSSGSAEAPTGLDFGLEVEDPGLTTTGDLAKSDLRKAVVTLPPGLITNPSVANGLGACSLARFEAETLVAGSGCPGSSKIGSVEVETPLLREKVLHGSLYVAKQGDNPNHNLLTVYLVIKDPETGILLRLAGAVDPDPQTGQLTSAFAELPRLPFSHFRLHFRQGERAPLITPALCGSYSTQAQLFPYAAPATARAETASFQITSGAHGGACATSSDRLPHAPTFAAGTLSSVAGAYSPFVLKLERADGSQQLSSVSVTLPKGLLGRLAGIPYCSEGQIAAAQARGGEGEGAVEIASPSCPAASRVGGAIIGAGAGSQPLYVRGQAYLAGPYKGAPLSLEIVTPAIAGPFDLGATAVRAALRVDPESAQITAVSDPIPRILHGLPLDVRSIALNVDRPNFTLNPTSCEPSAVLAGATSDLGQLAPLSQHFQASACRKLRFAPKLSLHLRGGTTRARFPSLRATVTYPKGAYANIARARVSLPHSEFLEQSHIRTVCTRVRFAAHECPADSVYGHATATSPLLEGRLTGPVYLRSSDHGIPDLVADLRGQVEIVLVGRIDTGRGGGIRTTFAAVPDAPVSKFTLELDGGRKGLLVNSENICVKPQRAGARFVAQNGKESVVTPPIGNGCSRRPAKR